MNTPPASAAKGQAASAAIGNQQVRTAAAGVVVAAATIAALYFGQDILVPLSLAALLSFALAPLVRRLQNMGLPRVPSVLFAVLLAFTGIAVFGFIVGNQVVRLAENLSEYQDNILTKLSSLQSLAPSGGLIERASRFVEEVSSRLSSVAPGSSAEGDAVTVQVQDAPATPLEVLRNVALPLLAPVGTAGIVVVVVIFMLLEREDLRDRLIRIFGGDLRHSTQALNDAASRVSRYLLTQLLVNSAYGIPIGIGLWAIGVPNALLWGLLAIVLRFVPYVGPFIAALFPISLAFAVDPGWTMLFWTVALILTAELVNNCVLEPRLYGSSTGISTVAILIAAIFWTALWGPIGLLLSTPLTVCLAVLGRHVPQLRFLDVMLGSDPVLSPTERLYQRMLSGDVDEGEEMADNFLRERPLASFYDEVGLPALRLAEADRARKHLAPEQHALVSETFVRVVAELADHDGRDLPDEDEAAPRPDIVWSGKPVLCVAGRSGLDRAAASMLAQLVERRGIGVRLLPADAISPEGVASLDLEGVELVCLAYLNGSAVAHARQAAKRIRRRKSDIRILVGLWNQTSRPQDADDPARGSEDAVHADFVHYSITSALKCIETLATTPVTAAMVPAPVPADEDVRLAALKELALIDTPPEEGFDRFTRKLARVFDAPISLVSLVDEERQFWKSATGVDDTTREAPRNTSICGHVVAANDVLVIEDVMKDKRFANNPWLKERGIRFYAGAPLRSPTGPAIGSVCVIDTEPRKFSERDKAFLKFVSDEVMQEAVRARPRDPAPSDGESGIPK